MDDMREIKELMVWTVLSMLDDLTRKGLIDTKAEPLLTVRGLAKADQTILTHRLEVVVNSSPPPSAALTAWLQQLLGFFDEVYPGTYSDPKTVALVAEYFSTGVCPSLPNEKKT